jgi:transcription antitermination factor NusG
MWYVIHSSPHHESQVARFLGAHGVESYAPEFPPSRRTKPGSFRDRHRRYVFPGYVFFQVPVGFRAWDVIRWAPGVGRVLQEDGAPACLSDGVIDHLRNRLAERLIQPQRPRFAPGQPVAIQSGALRMLDGIFERELDAPTRVRILVQLLGRTVPVEVDLAILRAAG